MINVPSCFYFYTSHFPLSAERKAEADNIYRDLDY